MKYISISVCALLTVASGLLGYFLWGMWGCAACIAFALVLVAAAYLLLRCRYPAVYARLSSSGFYSDESSDQYSTDLTAAHSGSGARSRTNVRRPPLGLPGHVARLDEQNARHVKRFWCYRSENQTLFFVRLRSGRLYCFYMRRATRGEGARWVIHKIEGCEYGDIAAQALKLMDDYRRIRTGRRDDFSHDIAPHGAR